jgi:hypothetical protein
MLILLAAPMLLGARRTGACGTGGRLFMGSLFGQPSSVFSELPANRTHTVFRSQLDSQFSSSPQRRTATVRLDTSSRFFLFTEELPSVLPTGSDVAGFSFFGPNWAAPRCADGFCSPMFDGRPVATGNVWEVPYDGGPFDERIEVDLSFVINSELPPRRIGSPMRSARNYDVGLCDITIDYSTIATLINRSVFPQVVQAVDAAPESDSFRDTSTQQAWVGGLLRATPDGSSDDRIAIRLEQVMRIFAYGAITPEVLGAEQITLTPSLARDRGANVLQFVLNDASPSFVSYTPRYLTTSFKSVEITAELRDELPGALAQALNDTLRPLVSIAGSNSLCDPTRSDADTTCQSRISDDAGARQIFGAFPATCVPFTKLTSDEQTDNAAAFCTAQSNNRPVERIGFCAVRLSPTRVQALPSGLQLVMADDPNDPRIPALRGYIIPRADSTPGLSATCDTTRQQRIDARTAPRTLVLQTNSTGLGQTVSCSGSSTAANSCARVAASAAPVPLPTCN